MDDQVNQDQVIETQDTPVAGELEADHPAEVTPEVAKPGGEKKETPKETAPKAEVKPVKTFTEEEAEARATEREAKVTSELQRQKADVEAQLNRARYAEQIRLAQIAEADELAKDRAQVEAGYIGEDVVQQRQQARQVTKQLFQQVQGIHGVVQQLRTEGESLGMALAVYHTAKEAAKEDGLTEFQTIELFDQLMKEGKYTSPDQVKGKVATLRLKKVKEALKAATVVPEKFDPGPTGSSGATKTEDQRLKERYPSMSKI